MKKMTQEEGLQHIKDCMKNKIESCAYFIWDETAVHYGEDGGFDVKKAKQHNLKMFDIKKRGGAMITHKGDICYALFTAETSDFGIQIREFLVEKLKEKNITATMVKNDLLIDGKKFLGDMKQTINNFNYYGGHISIVVDVDLIKDICTKPMQKQPVGLSEYGITQEEVECWLQEFWQNFKK